MRLLLLLLSCLFLQSVSAQKIYGTVFNANGDLLPYASISIKGTTKGTSANDKAKYALNIAPGTYTFVCQNLGYASSEKKLIVKGDAELSFILTEQKLTMDAVVVKKSGEDPAYEIIRNAIKKRNYYAKQVSQFTCNIYGKDLIKLKSLPKKVFGKKIPDADRKEMGLDSAGTGIIYLSESVSKVSVQQPDKIKLEVMSSRVSGSGGFGFRRIISLLPFFAIGLATIFHALDRWRLLAVVSATIMIGWGVRIMVRYMDFKFYRAPDNFLDTLTASMFSEQVIPSAAFGHQVTNSLFINQLLHPNWMGVIVCIILITLATGVFLGGRRVLPHINTTQE
jgi:hypothetical protein